MTEKSPFEMEKERLKSEIENPTPDDKKEAAPEATEEPKETAAAGEDDTGKAEETPVIAEKKEEKPDNEAFARLRREAAEAKRQKADLEAQIAAKEKKNEASDDAEFGLALYITGSRISKQPQCHTTGRTSH